MSKTTEETRTGPEPTLEAKLRNVETDTYGGSRCDATITDISEVTAVSGHGGTIRVTVELPSGREHREEFTIPEVASEQYAFVRLMREAGYSLGEAPDAVGAGIPVEVTEDGPSIVVPEPSQSIGERAAGLFDDVAPSFTIPLKAVGVLLWPLVGLKYYPEIHKNEWRRPPDWADWGMEYLVMGYCMSALGWLAIVGVVMMVYIGLGALGVLA